jgi:hypothetical protein
MKILAVGPRLGDGSASVGIADVPLVPPFSPRDLFQHKPRFQEVCQDIVSRSTFYLCMSNFAARL